jgi:D-lactate dehydrogenase
MNLPNNSHVILPGHYNHFYEAVKSAIPENRLITDPLRTLAYGTDASFYRLIPKIVVKADTEAEVAYILQTANRHEIPVTFRAAGTSLSGQAISDSVLVVAGSRWKDFKILEDGQKIRLQPGLIGSQANRYLAPFGRKIGPDPASINAAMIGGIAANNASGMCCGTAQNSYQTVSSMRILFQDGTLLDTADPGSRENFKKKHPKLLADIAQLGENVRSNHSLAERIRQKFKIKNTTGYSLNALVDYQDPFDIILRLMIGSEGTLGFISEITYDTVIEHPHKASALMIFPNMESACTAASTLKSEPVAAVELMDRAALRSVESKAGMPAYLKDLSNQTTALLVETRAIESEELRQNIQSILDSLKKIPIERPIEFTDKESEYTGLWNIRKGLFPAVGAVRKIGTTVIIEDVAFPIASLAEAALELQTLMKNYRYHEAIIFGHALEGNLHFVFTQDFGKSAEVERYRQFMHDVCEMVVGRYDGSLKAEHGTGRNMAPYVEMEWGTEAYHLMQRVKKIFDPRNLLNPGVIINNNSQVHIENLKPLPETNPIVDKCIECGFCEVNCPSRDLTFTPRQRIVARREISRLRSTRENPQRLQQLEKDYVYLGEQTCAVDGMCAMGCPVEINTGDHTKELRFLNSQSAGTQKVATWTADNFDQVTAAVRLGLKLSHIAHSTLGPGIMEHFNDLSALIGANRLPYWNKYMPRGVNPPPQKSMNGPGLLKVVYFPSCISRTMGPAKDDPDAEPLHTVILKLLRRAGYEVIYPQNMASLCCGTPFESKGFKKQADIKSGQLDEALMHATRGGELPVLCDTSPCLYRMRQELNPRLKLYEPVEFIYNFLADKLKFNKLPQTIAIHNTCSTMKMGLEKKFLTVAQACAEQVIVPERVGCCGFAGDRGFNFPELNKSALLDLRPAVSGTCTAGYSTSRTCEIGLSLHSGLHYKSIFYLLNRCTRPL